MQALPYLRLYLTIHRVRRERRRRQRPCRHCRHPRTLHQHHRRGTDCALCYCLRFRR